MKVRFSAIVFVVLVVIAFGLGVFLLVAAEETPAPGIILIGISAIALIFYFVWGKRRVPPVDHTADITSPRATKLERQGYELELERRRRGESDV